MSDQLKEIEENIKLLEEALYQFTGSKLEDAYFEIDANIDAYHTQVDNISTKKGSPLRAEKNRLVIKLHELDEIYEEKCKNAPTLLPSPMVELNMQKLELILKEINFIDEVIKCYKGGMLEHKTIDDMLLDVFEQATSVDAKFHDEVVNAKKKIIEGVQNSMMLLAQAYAKNWPDKNLMAVNEQLSKARSVKEIDALWPKIHDLLNTLKGEKKVLVCKIKEQFLIKRTDMGLEDVHGNELIDKPKQKPQVPDKPKHIMKSNKKIPKCNNKHN